MQRYLRLMVNRHSANLKILSKRLFGTICIDNRYHELVAL